MSEETPKVLWKPTAERIERATLTRYREWLERERGLRFDDYAALWQWSTTELEAFWETVVEYFGVEFSTQPEAVLGRREMPGAQWFPGARLSFAEQVFRGKRPIHGESCRPRRSCSSSSRETSTAIARSSLTGGGIQTTRIHRGTATRSESGRAKPW